MCRLHRLLILVALLGAGAFPAAAHAVSFGASVDGDFQYYARGQWGWTQVQDSLHKLRATGASVARSGVDWAATEPKGPLHGHARFNWSYDDRIVGALAAAHLTWEPMLGYTPKWAQVRGIRPARNRGGGIVSPLPPASDQSYATFAAAFAARYGVGGGFWRMHRSLPREPVTTFELWNEPDCRWTWGPDVDLQDYAALYVAAYDAIKRADRHSTVIAGGLAFTRSSLPRLLKAFEGKPLDALAVHPYARTPAQTVAVVRWVQAELAMFGRGSTPLYINEFGWNSVPDTWQATPKRRVASNVRQAIVALSELPHVRAVVPFEWSDPNWGLSGGALAAGIKQVHDRR